MTSSRHPLLLKGFSLRQLHEDDKEQMMRMQAEVLAALADPAWFSLRRNGSLTSGCKTARRSAISTAT